MIPYTLHVTGTMHTVVGYVVCIILYDVMYILVDVHGSDDSVHVTGTGYVEPCTIAHVGL